ncbi:MAG: DUF58 domain-containing protein [Defluviitaleaceae bacterium]|nr:DUF58 domain-containing protein [Defluviitaleaceae bacterium]MCL2262019.1 DUF58 domain-containing protein [Defluviitaleaceae bacterium]
MSVTKSFVLLVGIGWLVTFFAWRFGVAYFAMFSFWNLLVGGLFILDAFITPAANSFKARRNSEDILYFNEANEMGFYVKNTSRHLLRIECKDERLRHFALLPENDLIKWLQPNEEEFFSYDVVPQKRGSFLFSSVYIRYTGLLGLCVKHKKVPCPMEFKVYPNVRDLSKFRLMLQKNRLLPQGEKTVKNYGMGYEFESLRPYVDGDDYRKINWRATSRENKLIVNQYQVERNQPVYILLDIGRPMSYTTGGYKKLDHAINAALILADIVNQSGDKVGLMVFDSAVRSHIAPSQGAAHRNHLMETLYHVSDNRQTADYGGAFRALNEKQKRRALVFIFTDFELPEEARELISQMALLKKRHMPIVVFMENEKLDALAETPIRKKYDRYLRDTAREFQAERKDIFRHLSAMGIPNVESKAEDFAVAAVNRYIQLTG